MKSAVIIMFASLIQNWAHAALPSVFKTCKLTDPDLNECAKNSAQSGLVQLTQGLQKLRLILNENGWFPLVDLKMEPLYLPTFELPDANNGPIQIHQKYTDSVLHGTSSTKLDSLSINPQNLNMEIKAHMYFNMTGDYELSGKIMFLPIQGTGKYFISTDRGDLTFELNNTIVTRGDKKYIEVTEFDLHLIDYENLVINYDNLFGNKTLSDSMNKAINENLEELFPVMVKLFRPAYRKYYHGLLNKVFSMFSLDEMFPEDKERFL